MDLNSIAINHEAVEKGAWVSDLPGMGELRLKVRGIGNTDFRTMQNRLVAALPRAKRSDSAELERVTAECLLKTVLLDWQGLEANGQPVPYSEGLARDLLTSPKWVRFRDAVAYAASIVADEDAEALEADTGNS